jgi:hypothetical protein
MDRVCHGKPTDADIMSAMTSSNMGQWVVTPLLRTTLYSSLFGATEYSSNNKLLTEVRVKSQIALVNHIEQFMLHAAATGIREGHKGAACPNLSYFVDDAIVLLRILAEPVKSAKVDFKNHPLVLFKSERSHSWVERWLNNLHVEPTSSEWNAVWDEYVCALCDSLFGLWPAPGAALFHDGTGRGAINRCTDQIFSSVSYTMTPLESPFKAEYQLFDVAYIEACGPFRFKATDHVDQHLVLTENNEILFYTDWRKWTFLFAHRVLGGGRYSRPPTRLITLTNRFEGNGVEYGTSAAFIGIDILITHLGCFYQNRQAVEFAKKRTPTSRVIALVRSIFASRFLPGRTSGAYIAKRLGVEMSLEEAHTLTIEIHGPHSQEFGTILSRLVVFAERADKLQTALRNWKPRTIMELRYSGYGGVDPVGLYAFYFAAFFGIITVVGLTLTGAQTYAAFKALDIGGISQG